MAQAITAPPAAQTMARVEPLCRQRVKDLLPIFQEGFANKWLLGCCPCPTTLEEMEGTFRQYPDEKVGAPRKVVCAMVEMSSVDRNHSSTYVQ
mmetsp:Transcript_6166/g.21084  ORF Transcript_6166/g.21084 Transcript_6166/m.21084 type:complete len:93 (-) Transcript_6166:3477-3755(-)